MVMLSTSVLNIKWTIQGKPKSFIAGIGGDLIIRVNSQFTLNQISGQVIEHEELWDLSSSSIIAQAFFWTSRRLFATVEAAKDLADGAKDLSSRFSTKQENTEVYPDPSGDPTKIKNRWSAELDHRSSFKNIRTFSDEDVVFVSYIICVIMCEQFFQRDDGFQRDVYQIALFLAVLYFVVQFLRTTL
ncbi:hypothetical protein Goari_012671 [Gossypium aridum]|uniref:AT1G65230-like protein n=1 Tax=Gossypium aridum TaxID=34290 RepID=A0A7J8X168_GOSAI|nr:hypothetical protein [Gossypium aridum]